MAKQLNISIDKLKVCYKNPQSYNLFDYIITESGLRHLTKNEIDWGNATKIYFNTPDFYLQLIDVTQNESTNEYTELILNVICADGLKLGQFEISNSKYIGKCFFSMDNRALYTNVSSIYGVKSNAISYWLYVADCMDIQFNNITKIEIAFDRNKNFMRKVKKHIRNLAIEMFVNGHKVKDTTSTINGYKEIYTSSREQLSKQPSLYFKQSKGLELNIYNKSQEMNESTPTKWEYIPEWLGWGAADSKDTIYRAEIRAGNNDIREFYAFLGGLRHDFGEYGEILGQLTNNDFLAVLWDWCCHRLVYFRDGEREINLTDLL